MARRYFKRELSKMKIRTIVLAGASLIAFATPAAAAGDGWYLGFGLGWSQLNDLPRGAGHISTDSTVRGDIAAGYKWASGFRAELEDGYAQYKVTGATDSSNFDIPSAGGHISVGTVM